MASLCQVRFAVGHTQSRRLLVVAMKLVSIVILGRMLRTFVMYEWKNAKRRKWKIQSWLFIELANAEIFQTQWKIPQYLCNRIIRKKLREMYVREQVTTLEWYVFTYFEISSVEPTKKSKKTVRVEGTVEVTSPIGDPF